jgi:hypothetical protein
VPRKSDEVSKTGGLWISKLDEVVTIARALIGYLGEEQAAQVGALLRERTQSPAGSSGTADGVLDLRPPPHARRLPR